MRYTLAIILSLLSFTASSQTLKKTFKFATFYTAFSGGNSVADDNIYSVTNGLQTDVLETPFDYSFTAGVRKIARFGYENRANVFYDGTEKSYSDAATIGKVKGFEFLFEADWRRQQGRNFLDQDYYHLVFQIILILLLLVQVSYTYYNPLNLLNLLYKK